MNPYTTDFAAIGLPTHCAFDWRREPEPPRPLTAAEKERAYQREYDRARYIPAAERNAAITAFKVVSPLGNLNESVQSKDKTARIAGKRNSARSQ